MCKLFSGAPRARERSPIAKTIYPAEKIWQARDRTLNDRPSAPLENQCLISHFLASLGAQEQTDIVLILHISVVIN